MEKMHKMAHDVKACAPGCMKMESNFELYDPATKSVYALDDQKNPEAFAGKKGRGEWKLDRVYEHHSR